VTGDASATLADHRRIWRERPTLARLYRDEFFARLDSWAPSGKIVEVGAGPGLYKEHRGDVVTLDIAPVPWLDVCGDCLSLPFKSASLDSVVGIDVIHHLHDPLQFLREVAGVLRQGGRLVLVEPWNTPAARLVYTYAHEEDFDLGWSPEVARPATGERPFDGNQAIPYLLFDRYWPLVSGQVPELALLHTERFSFVSYLMTGGFRGVNLLRPQIYDHVLRAERRTQRLWRGMAALRALVVVERR
jgi:SAM-dependent methyltransferase